MYDQGSMDRIGRLMSLRDLVTAGQMAPDAAPLPMNTLRNNTTGAEYQFESSPQGGAGRQSPQLDYSQPIEIFGQGKGYAIKGQPLSAMINGRRVDYGVDTRQVSSSRRSAAQDLAHSSLRRVQQGLDAGALDIDKKAHGKFSNAIDWRSKAAYRVARQGGRVRSASKRRRLNHSRYWRQRGCAAWAYQTDCRGGAVRWRRSRNADKLDAKRTAAEGRAGAEELYQCRSSSRVWRGDYFRGVRQREKAVFPAARRRTGNCGAKRNESPSNYCGA
jgi:hypothetical protein